MKVHEYNIGTPMWSSQSIGLSESRINRHQILDVSILHKDAYGNRTFPDKYRVTKKFAEKYPKRTFKNMRDLSFFCFPTNLPVLSYLFYMLLELSPAKLFQNAFKPIKINAG